MICKKDKLLSATAYSGVLFFLPLLFGDHPTFCRYHANQGFLLLISGIVVEIFLYFVSWIFIVGFVLQVCLTIIWVCLAVCGICHALSGNETPIPLIGSHIRFFS